MVNPPTPKYIVITGGAQGVGRYITYHFFRKGHRICVLDTNVDGLLEFLNAHRTILPGGGLGIIALEKSWDLPNAICTARQGLFQYEDIDFLINVVESLCPDGPEETTVDHEEALEVWQEDLEIHPASPSYAARACIPHMKITGAGVDSEPGPCIINITAPPPPLGAIPSANATMFAKPASPSSRVTLPGPARTVTSESIPLR